MRCLVLSPSSKRDEMREFLYRQVATLDSLSHCHLACRIANSVALCCLSLCLLCLLSFQGYVVHRNSGTGGEQHLPLRPISLSSSSSLTTPDTISRVSWGLTGPPPSQGRSPKQEGGAGGPPGVRRVSTHHLMPPSLRSSFQSEHTDLSNGEKVTLMSPFPQGRRHQHDEN